MTSLIRAAAMSAALLAAGGAPAAAAAQATLGADAAFRATTLNL